MKTIYSKFLAIFMIAVALTASVNAQTDGDYRSKQSGGWTGQAVGTVIIDGGVITGINLTSGGQGYTTAPGITIQNGSGTVSATATLTGGVVTGTTITSGGSGCSVTTTAVYFANPTVVADQAANWEKYNGTTLAWEQAATLPTLSNNVTIQNGHTITIVGTATCKDLTVETGGVLTSPNYAANYVQTLALYGNVVNNGVIGNTSSIRSIGDGIRAYQNATGSTSWSGTGITNIGSFQVGGSITSAQDITISQSMELRRSNTGTQNLSLFNNNAGTAAKSITIPAGYTVKVINGGLHGGQNSTAVSNDRTYGTCSYIIDGTLDVSQGQFNVTNTRASASTASAIDVKVRTGGKLILGSSITMFNAFSGQTATITPETGSTIEFSGSTAPTFYSYPNGIMSIAVASGGGGTGYSGTISVSITGGGGSGATATATQTSGVVTAVTITNPGTGYTSTPNVSITGSTGGSGFTAGTITISTSPQPTFPTSFYNLVNNNTSATGVTMPSSIMVNNNLAIAEGTAFNVPGTLLNLGTITGTVASGNVVSVSSADVAKGTVAGSLSGSEVTLTGTPASGFVFSKWNEGATQISSSNPYVFTPVASQSLVASFDADLGTGLSKNEINAFVSVNGRNLKLSADVLSAELYNGVGQLISRQINNSTVSVNNSGIFIVKMNTLQGAKVQKVIVR